MPNITTPAITSPKTSFPALITDTAAPVNDVEAALFAVVGGAVTLAAMDEVAVDVTTAALAVEAVLDVGVNIVPLRAQEVTVTVTVVVDSLSVEDEAGTEDVAEAGAEVPPGTDDVDAAAAPLDMVGVPKPPETVGNGEAELPTAEQMALPAVLLDSMQIAPNCGWFRLSSQLPGPREVPEQRRMMGPLAQ